MSLAKNKKVKRQESKKKTLVKAKIQDNFSQFIN